MKSTKTSGVALSAIPECDDAYCENVDVRTEGCTEQCMVSKNCPEHSEIPEVNRTKACNMASFMSE